MSDRSLYQSAFGILFRGLALVLPFAVTVYMLHWAITGAEASMESLITTFLSQEYYFPGMGALLFGTLVLAVGLMKYPWFTGLILTSADKNLRRIPVFGSLYSPMRDLMKIVGSGMDSKLGKPAMIRVPNTQMETLGFITREDDSGLPEGFLPEGHQVVYVQWSSQIGGYCFVVPKDHIRPLDITVEEAMRWSLTAGVSGPGQQNESGK